MQIILKISVVLLSWCIYFTAAENRQGCWPNSDFYVMVFPENLKLNWTQHNDNCVTSIVYSDILNNTKITCFSNNKPKEFSVTSRYFDPVNNRNEYISDFIEIGSLTIRKTDEYILLRVLCPSAIIYSMVLYCRSSSDLGPEFKIRVTYPGAAVASNDLTSMRYLDHVAGRNVLTEVMTYFDQVHGCYLVPPKGEVVQLMPEDLSGDKYRLEAPDTLRECRVTIMHIDQEDAGVWELYYTTEDGVKKASQFYNLSVRDTAPLSTNTDNETTLKLATTSALKTTIKPAIAPAPNSTIKAQKIIAEPSTTPAPKNTVKPTPAPIATTLTTTKLVPDTRDFNPAEEEERINPDAAPVLTNTDGQTTVKAATIQAEPATTPVPNTTVMLATTPVPETTDYTYYTYVSGGCVGFAICFFVTLALFCIRKYRQSRLEQPELVYSYVAVEKVSHYAARALVTSNKKLGERSFVPRVPLRPGEYDYARPKQQPQFGDLEYDYATVGRNK